MAVGSNFVRKWLRYVDQFLLYPGILRKRVQQQPRDTVFVVTIRLWECGCLACHTGLMSFIP